MRYTSSALSTRHRSFDLPVRRTKVSDSIPPQHDSACDVVVADRREYRGADVLNDALDATKRPLLQSNLPIAVAWWIRFYIATDRLSLYPVVTCSSTSHL